MLCSRVALRVVIPTTRTLSTAFRYTAYTPLSSRGSRHDMEGESSIRAQNKPPRKPKQTQREGKQQGSAKHRGLPRDSPEVRLSKSVSWVLRHGARQEGLALRPDGYARVQDLVSGIHHRVQGAIIV